MQSTKIEWCDMVWNPLTGCTPVSRGCDNCYAARLARGRLRGRYGYDKNYPFRPAFHPDRVFGPLFVNTPQVIFLGSMTDLMHSDHTSEAISYVMEVILQGTQHTYVVLTKRPKRIREVLREPAGTAWPIPNLWLGVSVEDQETADDRIPKLLDQWQGHRLVSVEPMLAPVDLSQYLSRLEWVIIGAESGPGRRPCKLDWIRELVKDVVEAGVPVFVKQAEVNGRLVKMPEIDGRVWAERPEFGL